MLVPCAHAHPLAKHRHRDIERLRDARDADEARIADATLEAADVGRVEFSALADFELREVERFAAFADVESKNSEGPGARCLCHARETARSWTMSLWTMSQNVSGGKPATRRGLAENFRDGFGS